MCVCVSMRLSVCLSEGQGKGQQKMLDGVSDLLDSRNVFNQIITTECQCSIQETHLHALDP